MRNPVAKGALALMLVGGAYGGYKVYEHRQEQQIEQEQLETIHALQKSVSTLYKDAKKELLAETINQKKIDQVKREVQSQEEESFSLDNKKKFDRLLVEFANAENMYQLQEEAGQLLDENGDLKENASIAKVEEHASELHKIKPLFVETVFVKINEAKTQQTDIIDATNVVNSLFVKEDRKDVKDEVIRGHYDAAVNAVNKIKQEKAKQELTVSLDQVNTFVTQKEVLAAKAQEELQKQELLKKEQEESQKQALAKGNTSTAANSSISASSSTNSAGQSVSNNGGSALAQLVASSNTAQKTNQIVTVVASGTSATVTLLEKNNDGWKEVLSTKGYVGSQGVGQANESSGRTPKGSYSLGFAFGTSNPGTRLPFRQITPTSYWISNTEDPEYNTWQERQSSSTLDEHLMDYQVQYKYAIVINYNTNNPIKGAGSAFFLHVSNGRPTAGCVAVPESHMVTLMKTINSGAYIINVNSQTEIANY
jgi:L,D-peptidoglycan transpeptidase YkuD (ErfK/YbiS/YcfS/YnhG family)